MSKLVKWEQILPSTLRPKRSPAEPPISDIKAVNGYIAISAIKIWDSSEILLFDFKIFFLSLACKVNEDSWSILRILALNTHILYRFLMEFIAKNGILQNKNMLVTCEILLIITKKSLHFHRLGGKTHRSIDISSQHQKHKLEFSILIVYIFFRWDSSVRPVCSKNVHGWQESNKGPKTIAAESM